LQKTQGIVPLRFFAFFNDFLDAPPNLGYTLARVPAEHLFNKTSGA
jgi:hypothetical protein